LVNFSTKPNLEKIEMDRLPKLHSYHSPKDAIPRDKIKTFHLPKSKKSLILKLINQKEFQNLLTLRDQIHYILSQKMENQKDKKYCITLEECAAMFDLKGASNVKNYFDDAQNEKKKPPGKPSKLNKDQEQVVFEFIKEGENRLEPRSPKEVSEFVRNHFGIEVSESWAHSWIESHFERLSMVDAIPLEQERTKLTEKEINHWANKVAKKLIGQSWNFVCSWDESREKPRHSPKRRVVVMKGENKRQVSYRETLVRGGLSIFPMICIDGESPPPLVIIERKTIDRDLEKFGLPSSNAAHIVSTSKAYNVTDAIVEYVGKVAGPWW
jgi:hypothetical protein